MNKLLRFCLSLFYLSFPVKLGSESFNSEAHPTIAFPNIPRLMENAETKSTKGDTVYRGKVLQANKMVYRDGKGARREIYMPKGTMKKACQHYIDKNWGELAKYPIWSQYLLPSLVFKTNVLIMQTTKVY